MLNLPKTIYYIGNDGRYCDADTQSQRRVQIRQKRQGIQTPVGRRKAGAGDKDKPEEER